MENLCLWLKLKQTLTEQKDGQSLLVTKKNQTQPKNMINPRLRDSQTNSNKIKTNTTKTKWRTTFAYVSQNIKSTKKDMDTT